MVKKYLSQDKVNEIEKKIIIDKIKKILKSRDTENIFGLNLFEQIYWKNRIFDFNFFRKRIKAYIKNKLKRK